MVAGQAFRFSVLSLCLAAVGGPVLFPASAQSQEGGLVATVNVSQSLRWSDNPDFNNSTDDGRFSAVTGLSFGLSSQTRTQSINLSARSGLEVIGGKNSETDFIDPVLSFGYTLENRSSLLKLNGRYRWTEVGTFIPVEDEDPDADPTDFTASDLIFDTGRRQDYSLGAQLEFGRDAKFGGTVGYSLSNRSFTGITSSALYDTNTDAFNASLRFELSPLVTATLAARQSIYEAQDSDRTRRVGSSLSAGLTARVDDLNRLSFRLSADQTETSRLSGDSSLSGTGFSVGYSRTLKSGDFGLALSGRQTPSGRRLTFNLQHSRELPDGSLSVSLGATQTGDLPISPTLNLRYQRSARSSQISVALSQSARTDIDNNEIIATRLSASYSYQINALSSLSASMGLSAIDELSANGTDITRANLGLNYRHALGQDWNLVTGISHTRLSSTGSADRSANTLSVSLQRGFTFFP